MILDRAERKTLIRILQFLPEFDSPQAERALLWMTGLSFLSVDLAGDKNTACTNLVAACERAGCLPSESNYQALGALIHHVLELDTVPADHKPFLAHLLIRYELISQPELLDTLRQQYNLRDLETTPWRRKQQALVDWSGPLFVARSSASASLKSAGLELHEWKLVHFHVQRLLISGLTMRGKLAEVQQRLQQHLRRPSLRSHTDLERVNQEVEEYWVSYCERKFKELRTQIDHLQLIEHALLNSLLQVLDSNYQDNVALAVKRLHIDAGESFFILRNSYYQLEGLLIDVLTMSDLNILRLATEIQEFTD